MGRHKLQKIGLQQISPLKMQTSKQFIDMGLAKLSNGILSFTPKGFLVSNDLILKLIMSQD